MVHALFVDHAHLTQKPRRFCWAGGDGGLYALQRLAASLSKLLPVASPSRLDAAGPSQQRCWVSIRRPTLAMALSLT